MIEALVAATRSQFQPRMLGLVLWPLLGSLLLWGVLAVVFWHSGLAALTHFTTLAPINDFLVQYDLRWIASGLVAFVLLLLLPTLVVATALFITSVVAMPIMVEHVAARDYPQLAKHRGGSALGSIGNSLAALFVYLLLWLLVLPLWLILPFAVFVPLLLNGYLNDRVFRYDALAEHATPEEYREILRRRSPQLLGLGVVAALIQLVPFVNLVSPVYSGLSFIHYALAELQRLRAERGSGLAAV
ncbi:MAG: EI24 domain-containing protein [Nevskia sp.]